MRTLSFRSSLSLLFFGAIAFVIVAASLATAFTTRTHTRSESFEMVNASTPASSTNVPSTSTVAPNTTTVAPNTTTAAPNTTIGTPVPAPVYSRTRTVEPETTNATAAPTTTTVVATNASTTAPNTTTVAPNTTTAAPNTTTVAPNTTTSTSTPAPPPPTTTTTTTTATTTTTTTPAPPVSSAEKCKNEYILYSSGANPSRLCDTYNCLEAKFKCQSEAEEANRYFIDYAKDRCVRRESDLRRKLKSNSSLTWLSSTRQCLQKTLVDNIEDSWTCSKIASFGYKSEWPCFTTSNPSGISLCDLRTNEQVKIAKELRGGLGNACSLVRESVDGFQNCHKKVLRYAKVRIQVKRTARLLISILRRIISVIKNRCSKLNIQVLGSLISKIQERSTKATCTAVDDDDTTTSSSSFSSSFALNRFASILSNDESLTGNFTLTLALAPNETSTTIDDDLAQLNNDPMFNSSSSSSSSDSDLSTIISNAVTENAADTVQVLSVSEASSSDYGEDEDTSNRNSQQETSSGLSTAAATGTAIGVVVVVVVVIAVLVTLYLVKKGKKNDDGDIEQTVQPSEDHEMTSLQMP